MNFVDLFVNIETVDYSWSGYICYHEWIHMLSFFGSGSKQESNALHFARVVSFSMPAKFYVPFFLTVLEEGFCQHREKTTREPKGTAVDPSVSSWSEEDRQGRGTPAASFDSASRGSTLNRHRQISTRGRWSAPDSPGLPAVRPVARSDSSLNLSSLVRFCYGTN